MFKLCCNQINTSNISQNTYERDFPSSPVAETPHLMQRVPVQSLVRSDPIHQTGEFRCHK